MRRDRNTSVINKRRSLMNRRGVLNLVGLGAATFGALEAVRSARADEPQHHEGPMDDCAKACVECLRECESCANHCAHLLASGMKEHLTTLQTCSDCAEICGAAAKITSRHGPMAATICEACAKACDDCAAACEKTSDDQHMQKCAKACRDCSKACREMVKHLHH